MHTLTDNAAEHRKKVERVNRLSPTVVGYRRQRIADKPKPQEAFEIWLDAMACLICLLQVQVVRQSSKNRREYVTHFETSTVYREADPDVAAVRQMDIVALLDGLVADVPTFRIEKRHLPGGGRSTAYVGTAVIVGQTLFLFILNSAAEDNLKGLHEDLAGNAFTATVQASARRLSFRLWADDLYARLWVHFPNKSRLARDDRHAINLVDTLGWVGAILRIQNEEYADLDTATTKMVLQIFLSVSAQELESIVERLFGPRLGLLRAGRWLGQETPPITHDLVAEACSNAVQTWTEQDSHAITPRPEAVPMLTGLIDEVLRSAGDNLEVGPAGINANPKAIPNWKRVARFAGTELGVQSRDWTHRQRGGLTVDKLEHAEVRLRSYLDDRWIEGWKTGWTPNIFAVPKVIASSFDVQLTEQQEWVERDNGTVAIHSKQSMPLPELVCDEPETCTRDGHRDTDGTHLTHGFGIPEWKWTRLQELLVRTSKRTGEHPGGGHGDDSVRHPLASTFEYSDGGRQFRLSTAPSVKWGPTYQLYTRATKPDPNRPWTKGANEICRASVVAAEANRRLGADLENLLHEIDRQTVALTVTAESDQGPDPIADASEALDQAHDELAEAEQRLGKAREASLLAKVDQKELQQAPADTDAIEEADAQVAAADKMLATARASVSAAKQRVSRADAQLAAAHTHTDAEPEEGSTEVDLSEPLLVAKALQQTDGATRRVLNDAVLQMLDPDTSRIDVPDDDHRNVVFRPTWRFIDQESNEALTYPRTIHVPRLPANPKTKTKTVDLARRNQATIPRLLLRDGETRDGIVTRFDIGFQPGEKKSYGFQIMDIWFTKYGITPALRQPLLDAPPIVRKIVYLKVTDDQAGLHTLIADQELDRDYVDCIVARYTGETVVTRRSWPATWAPSNHAHDRAVIDELVNVGGLATIGHLATRTGLAVEEVARTAHVVPHSQRHLSSPKFAQPAAVIKGEWRSRTATPLAAREIWLLACPHEDCDGFVTHPLWTPETDPHPEAEHQHAALCPTCRRAPWGPHKYPPDYFRRWAGPVSRAGGPDTRKTTVLTAQPHVRTAAAHSHEPPPSVVRP